jgi:NitT/TauT family transport system permease protein
MTARGFRVAPRRSAPLFIAVGTLLIGSVVWELAVSRGLVNELFFAAPSQIVAAVPRVASKFASFGTFTLSTFIPALLIVALLGGVIGLIAGSNKYLHGVISPLIGFGMVTPKIALVPVLTIWIGYGSGATIFVAVFLGVFPVILSVMAAVKQIDPRHLRLAMAHGHSYPQIIRKVVLPGIVPYFFMGLFFGSHATQIGVLLMELKYGTGGLGYLLRLYQQSFDSAAVFAVVLMAAAVLMLLNGTLWYFSRYFDKWRLD